MSKVTGYDAVALSEVNYSEIIEKQNLLPVFELIEPDAYVYNKRFGIVDLWKIHSGKRLANVYPRRV